MKGTVGKRVGQCVEGVQGWVSRCETPSHRLHVVVERLNGGGRGGTPLLGEGIGEGQHPSPAPP